MNRIQSPIVVPGELLDESGEYDAGANTYKEGSKVYAQRLGLKRVRENRIDIVSLSGRYDPNKGDLIIGRVVETGPSNWYIEVGAPTDVGMHVNEVPWRVDFGETAKYLDVGDTVLLKVYHVDELRKAQVTMKDKACRKLTGGVTVSVDPSKVPRIIGRGGSMVRQIKGRTRTRMFVGRNGVIWIDGEPDDVSKAIAAIRMVEQQAHTKGLTERVGDHLDELGARPEPEGGYEEDEDDRSMSGRKGRDSRDEDD